MATDTDTDVKEVGSRRAQQRLLLRDLEDFLKLLQAHRYVRGGQVDLVDDGDDSEVLAHCEVEVRDCLRLDSLGCVDEQDCALAGGEASGDLVVEVHVSGGVDEVEVIPLPVLRVEPHLHRMGADCDAPFLLQVHVVEKLVVECPHLDSLGVDEEPVRQGGLSVVHMGDDGEVSYM